MRSPSQHIYMDDDSDDYNCNYGLEKKETNK